jgi:hypothetical protein
LIELPDRCRIEIVGVLFPPTEDRGFHDAGCTGGFSIKICEKNQVVKNLHKAISEHAFV